MIDVTAVDDISGDARAVGGRDRKRYPNLPIRVSDRL